MEQASELQAQIDDLTSRLERAEKNLDSFLYIVSHDLRAPLRAIISCSMILTEDFGDRLGPEGVRELERQTRAAKRIGAIVDDLVKLSRLRRQPMNPAKVDLSDLVTSLGQSIAKDQGREITLQIEPNLEEWADPQLIHLALHAMVDNAIKFTPDSNPVVIKFGRTDEGFYLSDDGMGFPPQDAERIFKPFEKLLDHMPGSGIGLSAALLAIEKQRGLLWASGKPDEGATFFFTLGIDAAPASVG